MSLIRGVLVAGRFRTHHEALNMTADDQRNTVIVELNGRTNQSVPSLQAMDDATLAGVGAVYIYLRSAGIRDEAALKTMTADDQRNTLIVELAQQTGMSSDLQALGNTDLVSLGLGKPLPGSLNQGTFLRGVVAAARLRTQQQLNTMSDDNQRNLLISHLSANTAEPVGRLQALNNFDLAGVGAVYVFLRETRIRDAADLRAMSADDQRNTLIVEIAAQTGLGGTLQGFRNLDLVLTGLGISPKTHDPIEFQPLPVRYVFSITSFEAQEQKSDNHHSDSDWLTYTVAVANTTTKGVEQVPQQEPQRLEGSIKTGNVIAGPFATTPIRSDSGDVVVINYTIMNLGSSRAEDQFAQAVKIADKIVGIVAPAVGAVLGLFLGSPGSGLQIGQQVSKAVDDGITALGDVFEFLGIHAGPANCNGEVASDTLAYTHTELLQAIEVPVSKVITGPQGNNRCGAPPRSKITFTLHQVPFEG